MRKKAITTGALASGALALGLGTSGATTAQQASSALVYTYDFDPNRRFEEVARLQQTTTNGILEDVVNQPDEWTGFIARYRVTEDDPGEFFITFTRGGSLGTGTFGDDVTFFASGSNLLVAAIAEVDVETETPAEEERTTEGEEITPQEEVTTLEEEETPTPGEEEETTEEVVVEDETTTESDGGG